MSVSWPVMVDPQGHQMVPLRCRACRDQIALVSPTHTRGPAFCFACAVVEELCGPADLADPINPEGETL